MSRPNLLGASAVLASASLILLLILLVTQGVAARAPTSPPVSAVNAPRAFQLPSEYCYSWDFNNSTGHDATGVHLRLSNIQTLTQVYTDTLNPFGDLDPSSGYDAGTATYRFNFDNGIAYDADRVLLGLCTDQPQLRLDQTSGAAWLSDTTSLAPAPLFAGIEFNWVGTRSSDGEDRQRAGSDDDVGICHRVAARSVAAARRSDPRYRRCSCPS